MDLSVFLDGVKSILAELDAKRVGGAKTRARALAAEIEAEMAKPGRIFRGGAAPRCRDCQAPRMGRPPKNPPAVYICSHCQQNALKQLRMRFESDSAPPLE